MLPKLKTGPIFLSVVTWLMVAIILLGVSAELSTDSCFYIANDDGISNCFVVNNCSCTLNLTLAEIQNGSHSENIQNCTCAKGLDLRESWKCLDGSTCNSSLTTNSSDLSPCSNSSTCQNGGTCEAGIDSNYTCNCTEDFEGLNCQTPKNVSDSICSHDNCTSGCLSTPCLNNGTCLKIGNSSLWMCSCPMGFNGTLCENGPCSMNISSSEEVQCTSSSKSPKLVNDTTTESTTSTEVYSTPLFNTTTAEQPTVPATKQSPSSTPLTVIPVTPPTKNSTPEHRNTSTLESSPTTTVPPEEWDSKALIIGLVVGILGPILLAGIVAGVVIQLKKSRATTGRYEPSREEKEGANIYHNILALPPEERLI